MKTTLLVVVATAALVVLGCAPKKQPDPKVTAQSNAAVAAAGEGVPAGATAAGASAAALPVIGPAPVWNLKDVDGKVVSSDSFKGKVVVLDFWATWCPPCRAEIPGYVELAKKYPDKLVIVGASVDEGGPQVVRDFIKKFGINYPVVMADAATVAAYGNFESIPTTFLIDRDGKIRDKKVGAEEAAVYEQKIKTLLN